MTTNVDRRKTPDQLAKLPKETLEPPEPRSAAIRGAAKAFSPLPPPTLLPPPRPQPISAASHGAKAAAAAATATATAGIASRPIPVPRPQGRSFQSVQADPNRLTGAATSTRTQSNEPPPGRLILPVAKSPSSIAAQAACSIPIRPKASSPIKDSGAINGSLRRTHSHDGVTSLLLTHDEISVKERTSRSANSASLIDRKPPARNSLSRPRMMKSPSAKEEVARDYSNIPAPQPIRPTATRPVLATILALEQLSVPEGKTASTWSQPSPKASAGMLAARAAAKSAAPVISSPTPRKVAASPAIDIPSSKPPLPSPRRDRSQSRTSEVETDFSSSWTSDSRISFRRTDTNTSSMAGDLARTTSSAQIAPRRQEGKPGMTPQALADAIVASSLASSRAYSPPKPAPRPPARRSKSHSLFHHHHNNAYEVNMPEPPSRGLRHTLRKHSSDNEEEGVVKRGRHHFMRKHPNKHHEGDRKRWRDGITERERKRYEGVWAANRGLFTFWQAAEAEFGSVSQAAPEKDSVLNLVVREIWERSHLPRDVLEEIWDLVASTDGNTLSRHEFVVGLWLIDQSLKGRKLPVKVSPSVWSSVRHTHGVKVMKTNS